MQQTDPGPPASEDNERHHDLTAAARTWNKENETLASVNARIHDGVSLDQLEARADRYVRQMFDSFSYVRLSPGARIMEVGSGAGYIMEAMTRELSLYLNHFSISGLDIADHMLAKAKRRIGQNSSYTFVHYDGITIPVGGQEFDLVYSVACLQHIPKLYVYNLLFEIKRILRPNGFAILHLLSFKTLFNHSKLVPWDKEIKRQMNRDEGHWHHFYTSEELLYVSRDGTGFEHVDIRDGEAIWICLGNRSLGLPPDFDPGRYLALNLDVAEANADPVSHWLTYGSAEGRRYR